MSSMILATDENSGIGINNKIPWYSKDDFKHFKDETKGKIVIMGYKTWQSLPKKPLSGRLNIVLLTREYTNRTDVDKDVSVLFMDISALPNIIENNPDCVVIGGATIYEEAIKYVDTVILSTIQGEYECDTFFNIEMHASDNAILIELASAKVLGDGTIVEYWSVL